MTNDRWAGCEFEPTAEDHLIDQLHELWGELSDALEGRPAPDLDRIRERAAAIVEFVDQVPKQ